MRMRMRRRSASSLVSPGPRVPMPPPSRDSARPAPTSRGSRYFSCANSTWRLPSRVRARLAKMSRMSCVRSITLRSSRLVTSRSCAGDNSLSKMTTSTSASAAARASSSILPLPRNVAGSGLGRSCRTRKTTCAPAASASPPSSSSECSASTRRAPPVTRPTSAARSTNTGRRFSHCHFDSHRVPTYNRRSACMNAESSSRAACPYPVTPRSSLSCTSSLSHRSRSVQCVATAIFCLAVLHTFVRLRGLPGVASRPARATTTTRAAGGWPPHPSVAAEVLHFLGEVEVVFGLWAVAPARRDRASRTAGTTATHYVNDTVELHRADVRGRDHGAGVDAADHRARRAALRARGAAGRRHAGGVVARHPDDRRRCWARSSPSRRR